MTTEDPTDGRPAALRSILLQLATDLEHEAVDTPRPRVLLDDAPQRDDRSPRRGGRGQGSRRLLLMAVRAS